VLAKSSKLLVGHRGVITYHDLVSWTLNWVPALPRDYDVIVGIPREGLLIATILSLQFGKPLATPDSLVRGQIWTSRNNPSGKTIKNILLVDDSSASGESMSDAVKYLQANGNWNISTAALFVIDEMKNTVDYHLKSIQNELVESALVHHKKTLKIGFDMDGVICEDCPPPIDDNEDEYVKWITTVRPRLIPTYTIDIIVSNRLEKYRHQTEAWLHNYGVKYSKLVLWDISSKAERIGNWTDHKIAILQKERPTLFYESDINQAEIIHKRTGIPVLCTDTMVLFDD
jgi:uncharacterized HAD superfamily protein/orotate phosphoribosyltransferase